MDKWVKNLKCKDLRVERNLQVKNRRINNPRVQNPRVQNPRVKKTEGNIDQWAKYPVGNDPLCKDPLCNYLFW